MGNVTDKVSSDQAKAIFNEQLRTEDSRKHMQSTISEYVDSVPFMEKVRKYAGQEIDSRLFVGVKFWLTTAGAALVSSLITAGITFLALKYGG